MRRTLIIKSIFVFVLGLAFGSRTKLFAQQQGVQLSVITCLQYQKTKSRSNNGSHIFRNYGFHSIISKDSVNRLWGYHVRLDSAWTKKLPVYRSFQRHDLLSFAIIDSKAVEGSTQYVFWWKGYYRRFADELRRMGFTMTNDKRRTNILRFSREDTDVVVDFIIWDDIYVMQLSFK